MDSKMASGTIVEFDGDLYLILEIKGSKARISSLDNIDYFTEEGESFDEQYQAAYDESFLVYAGDLKIYAPN